MPKARNDILAFYTRVFFMKVVIIYNKDLSGVINEFGLQNKAQYNPKTVRHLADALEQGGHNVRIIDDNMKVIESDTWPTCHSFWKDTKLAFLSFRRNLFC